MERGAGVLCHISSLPGKYGIGGLGKEAYLFANMLSHCCVKYWQILPLVQTGFLDSPYQSVYCNSGNPYFLDLEEFQRMGLLTKFELKEIRNRYQKVTGVNYQALFEERYETLRKAFSRFHLDDKDFCSYVKSGEAEEYALYMTAKKIYQGPFYEWEEGIKFRNKEAIAGLKAHREEYLFWHFLQFMFQKQWKNLKGYCNRLGIKIIGDLPLYVACDSADVWVHPELFELDDQLKPSFIAGVPPDYFSKNGQIWGNPVYRWEAHERENFQWWTSRLQSALKKYDYVRLDHFRGIDRFYRIPANAETAAEGNWESGPKEKLFQNINCKERFIAEDLGIIDEGVKSLLKKTNFPGMKVLLFAFDGNPENPYLPENYTENSVCYTGTHDNDTVCGYVKSLSSEEFILFRSKIASELDRNGIKIALKEKPYAFARAFMELALQSRARAAIIPIQDLMEADNSCRMNFPGMKEGNWRFRLKKFPSARKRCRLKNMIKKYRR